MKANECRDCPIYVEGKEPSPIAIDYGKWPKDGNGDIDVLFVGEAFNSTANVPFGGRVGILLHKYRRKYGIDHYGVTNMYKCRYSSWARFNAASRPGLHCRNIFVNEELRHNPKLVVFLSSEASKPVTKKNIREMPDGVTTVNLRGQDYNVIAVPHPTSIDHYDDRDENWKTWNRRWLIINKYLKEVLS